MISKKLKPFGTSIFGEMTRLAQEHGAINLSQGFPDFEGPEGIIDAALQAMRSGENQYARSLGHPKLVHALADHQRNHYGLDYDPLREVLVFCGATEGIASSMLGLLNPGDEVILFEPFYDSYPACVALAGAVPRFCTLSFPDFALDADELGSLFNDRTRLVVLNTPHNPTGKVFQRAELDVLARLCQKHDVLVLADEVYEHLTFGDARHIPMASLPGMRERTLTLSSTGKTFSMTGWKIGWGTGPQPMVAAAHAAHQFVTYAVATPLQVAMASALQQFAEDYLSTFRQEYQQRRDFLVRALQESGLEVAVPEGTYFVLARFAHLFEGDDQDFARYLIQEHGVAAIPPSFFYQKNPEAGRQLIRFAFCKQMPTLEAAAAKLRNLRP